MIMLVPPASPVATGARRGALERNWFQIADRREALHSSESAWDSAPFRRRKRISTACSGPRSYAAAAIMFCLLPPTRLALGHLAPAAVPDASGLFNLMRNLGGAIGLALIDSVIYGRAPVHATAIIHRLMAGDVATAKFVGIRSDYSSTAGGPAGPRHPK